MKKFISAAIIFFVILVLILIGAILFPPSIRPLNILLGFIYGFTGRIIWDKINCKY